MPDYLALVANCALATRKPLLIAVEGLSLELHQSPQLPNSVHQFPRSWIHTTDLYVRNTSEGDLPKIERAIKVVCELLSFATESQVCFYGHEYPAGSGIVRKHATVGTVQIWRPPFDDPQHVTRFVELCYPHFAALRDRRKLNVTIDYIHHSIMRGLAQEVKIGLACITFENLRHNWATDTGYRFIDGYFREKTATPAAKDKTVGFKRHLKEMFIDVGIAAANAEAHATRIYDIRNEVIHTGLYGDVHNYDHFEFIETTLREYFLRLVGFTGQFYAYVGGSSAPLTIP